MMSNLPDSTPDPDATIMVPSPGKRRPAATDGAPAARPSPPPGPAAAVAPTLDLRSISGLNPIIDAANSLLSAVPRIRTTVSHPDPDGLRETMLRQIAAFEQTARSKSVPSDSIQVARYAMCTLIDEAVASTPWGGTAQWAKNPLLVILHREGWGGEKFFQLLNKMAEDPGRNVDLLELFYVCLALGFEGRFRVADNGKAQLETVRERLHELIRKSRGEYERDLSPRWRGEQTRIKQGSSLLGVWVTVAVAGVAMLGTYFYFAFSLNGTSDAIAWNKLKTPALVITPKATAEPLKPIPPRLSKFLAREIEAGLVDVRDTENASLVTIRGDGLFQPGSAVIKADFVPLVGRIAEEINKIPGPVIVTGHSDDSPIRSVRFPSNWHLSQERAASVAKLMSAGMKEPGRIRGEGLADTYPVAPNDSAANRAKNRRVEIVLKVAS